MGEDIMSRPVLLDGSRLIVEALARAGADAYVGYPITPASLIYTYSSRRFPAALPAPDEITALQWMSGLSAAGHLPVTATSFPGFALMVESINMAYMMELPMLVVLVQRLGPATGTATAGAQGDLFLLHGLISGGYPLPVLCIADMDDCWRLPPVALRTAVELRTPVVLLTSKEMVMTERSFDLARLDEVEPIARTSYDGPAPYRPYAAAATEVAPGGLAAERPRRWTLSSSAQADGQPKAHQVRFQPPVRSTTLTPPFLPVGNDRHQVRLNASTHDTRGILQHTNEESLANTRRLPAKVEAGTPVLYHLDEQPGAETLVVTYDVTTGAAREAVAMLRAQGTPVSLLVAQTLLPIPPVYYDILDRYPRVVVAEENLQGQLARLLFGQRLPERVRVVGGIGQMIRPDQIIQAVCKPCEGSEPSQG